MMVAILVAHVSLGEAKAQDFGFPFNMNNGDRHGMCEATV